MLVPEIRAIKTQEIKVTEELKKMEIVDESDLINISHLADEEVSAIADQVTSFFHSFSIECIGKTALF